MASFPFEFTVPLRSAIPWIPAAGSMNPDAARFIFCTEIFAFSGVSAASLASMGPAVPVSFMFPPAGRFAVISNGNDELNEKFFTAILTSL